MYAKNLRRRFSSLKNSTNFPYDNPLGEPKAKDSNKRRKQYQNVLFSSTNINFCENCTKKEKKSKRFRRVCHSLKLQSDKKSYHSVGNRSASFSECFSELERKALRSSLTHSLMRARGASSMFVINPAFSLDIVSSNQHGNKVNALEKENSASEKNSNSLQTPIFQSLQKEVLFKVKKTFPRNCESGYGSDALDWPSDSLEWCSSPKFSYP